MLGVRILYKIRAVLRVIHPLASLVAAGLGCWNAHHLVLDHVQLSGSKWIALPSI
jgi:hypothetical protein